jgi:hypothetical protein
MRERPALSRGSKKTHEMFPTITKLSAKEEKKNYQIMEVFKLFLV